MIVGTISYQAHSGLGHLARSFIGNGVVQRIFVLRHRHYPNYHNWYPAAQQCHPRRRGRKLHPADMKFLEGLDRLLLFENAWEYWPMVAEAKKRRIPVALIPNYEYTPFPVPVTPDVIICASRLDVDYYQPHYRTEFVPIPVDTKYHPWRLRERARVFVHNTGHGGWEWRNGTPWLWDAMQYVRSPIRMILRGQPGEERVQKLFSKGHPDPRVSLSMGELGDDRQLYEEGDVYVAPERYNGMSLPLQEAYASGMLVMTTRRYPMTTWLPNEPMLPVASTERTSIGSVEFERCALDPVAIAETIDAWYDRDISEFSRRGQVWAQENSWEALKPKLLTILQGLGK